MCVPRQLPYKIHQLAEAVGRQQRIITHTHRREGSGEHYINGKKNDIKIEEMSLYMNKATGCGASRVDKRKRSVRSRMSENVHGRRLS